MTKVWLLTLLCLGLAACGGSGSGGTDAPPVVTPPTPSIGFDPSSTTFSKDRANFAVNSNLFVTVRNTTVDKIFLSAGHTKAAITSVAYDSHDPNSIRLEISHRPPATLYNGTYTDRITIQACLDQACSQPLSGSPLNIPITYILSGADLATGATGPAPDPEATPLSVLSRVTLPHDVVDAEYSRVLDRVVIAASYPVNALHLYDPATDTEVSVPLSHAPTAVSLSPDGLTAAVGHRGYISIVALAHFGQQPADGPRVFTVSKNVFDLALDGRNSVHFIRDGYDISAYIHTLDVTTGTETQSESQSNLFSETYVRLHPAGDFLFHGDPLSTKVTKWDVTGPRARFVVDGSEPDFADCGKLWFDEPGIRVFTRCGRAFSTEGVPGHYLPTSGLIELSYFAATMDNFRIEGMDHSATRNEIAFVESNFWCAHPDFNHPCFVRFRVIDGELLTSKTMHSLPPISVDGLLHQQLGMFVFFNATSSRTIFISKLDALAEPGEGRYLLSVLE